MKVLRALCASLAFILYGPIATQPIVYNLPQESYAPHVYMSTVPSKVSIMSKVGAGLRLAWNFYALKSGVEGILAPHSMILGVVRPQAMQNEWVRTALRCWSVYDLVKTMRTCKDSLPETVDTLTAWY